MKKYIYGIALAAIIGIVAILANHTILSFSNVKDFLASVFFVDSITVDDLHARYNAGKVKILIVPGHDNEYSGTEFRGTREADLTLDLGTQLAMLLKQDPRFDITVSRDAVGYTKTFSDYFTDAKNAVITFENSQRQMMNAYTQQGSVAEVSGVEHNAAPSIVAYRLYAINKWADDNKIDLVVHIHFNDYRGRKAGQTGTYSGFSIYVPENQFSNAKASKAVADNVFSALKNDEPVSNLPIESRGIIPDQELIAIGANNSLDAAGFLVEYGYIYEPAIFNASTREATLKTLAYDTYKGIESFFNQK